MPDPKPVFKRYHDLVLQKVTSELSTAQFSELKECEKFINEYFYQESKLYSLFDLAIDTKDVKWQKEILERLAVLRGDK